MRRAAAALTVVALAVAPLALGTVPTRPEAVGVVALLAVAGGVGVWRAPGLALAIGAAGLTLAVADLATRPFVDHVFVRPQDRYVRLWRVDPLGARHDAQVDVVWPTVGDLAATGGAVRQPRTVRFATDALGFRTDPLPGPAQVVLLGDSFGAGVGTDQDEIAASLLTTRHSLPTVNLSISGASPYDEAVTLADVVGGLDLAPDAVLVWMLFAGNDFADACQTSLPTPPSGWNRARAWWATFRVRSVIGQLVRRLHASPAVPVLATLPDGTAMTFYRPDLDWTQQTAGQVRASPEAACVRGVFGMVGELAREAGLRVVVAVAPMKVQVYGPAAGLGGGTGGAAAVLREFAREREMETLDLEPALADAARRGLPSGDVVWWRDDTHWNAAGHAVVARALAHALAADSAAGRP